VYPYTRYDRTTKSPGRVGIDTARSAQFIVSATNSELRPASDATCSTCSKRASALKPSRYPAALAPISTLGLGLASDRSRKLRKLALQNATTTYWRAWHTMAAAEHTRPGRSTLVVAFTASQCRLLRPYGVL
jgi:hypothetical protein